MRLRRTPQGAVYFEGLGELAELLQESALVLAELSGIPAEDRREASHRMDSLCDRADEAVAAIVRVMRENFITPLDREDIYALADALREVCYRQAALGFAMSSSAFRELPPGLLEMLALSSTQVDQTTRMVGRLSGKPDQWEYVVTVDQLHRRAVALQQKVSDAVPASRQGLVFLAAALQVSQSFVEISQAFKGVGHVVARIALKES
ncbi:DUF47 domain-containing protein [Brevibacterium litoralis]|uniref:DUF47 domain-containing protein n=1 Tax=Brevibacterium litoralis TaxID=3138935 RepID=UPI0032EFE3DF